jgi:hypothetical protein
MKHGYLLRSRLDHESPLLEIFEGFRLPWV